MSLFFPYYDKNGQPNIFPRRDAKKEPATDPLTTFFNDLNKTAELLNKAGMTNTLYNHLKDMDNTRFDNLVSTDENSMTYIINVPEEINQNDISIDVTNNNRTLIVEIEKSHGNGTTEAYRHIRTTPRSIDVENLEAHLDVKKSHIVVEIPFKVQEDELAPQEDETIVSLAINVGEDANGKAHTPEKDEADTFEGKIIDSLKD